MYHCEWDKIIFRLQGFLKSQRQFIFILESRQIEENEIQFLCHIKNVNINKKNTVNGTQTISRKRVSLSCKVNDLLQQLQIFNLGFPPCLTCPPIKMKYWRD